MNRKLLTVEDLALFCKQKHIQTFSSKETGSKIAIQVPARFEVQDSDDNPQRGLLRVKVWAYHEGLNVNKSFFNREFSEEVAKTFAYRPILANIHCVDEENDDWDFGSHDFEYYIGKDGQPAINYIEKQIGAYSSEAPFWEVDPETGKNFMCAYAYIPEDYTRAASILREKGGTVHSCEFIIEDLKYNDELDCVEFTHGYLNGSTFLGRDVESGREVQPGMQNSHAEIVDFSVENNSIIPTNNELLAEMKKVTALLSAFKNFAGKEEGNQMKVSEQFVLDTLAKYSKTVEDIDFDYAEMSEEEFEAKCAEVFGEAESETIADNEPESEPVVTESNEEDPAADPAPASEPEVEVEAEAEAEADAEVTEANESAEIETAESESFAVNFELSHDDIRTAIYEALWKLDQANDYNTCYHIVSVFDDHFIYGDWASMDNKFFKQSYTKTDNTVEFSGTPVVVYAEYVTEEERNTLNSMRSNYAELVEFKENIEKQNMHAQREQILNSDDYAVLADDAAFAELKSNMDNYSLDELQNKADLCFAAFVKKAGSFSRKDNEASEDKVESNVLHFNLNPDTDDNQKAKREAYPGLFEN